MEDKTNPFLMTCRNLISGPLQLGISWRFDIAAHQLPNSTSLQQLVWALNVYKRLGV